MTDFPSPLKSIDLIFDSSLEKDLLPHSFLNFLSVDSATLDLLGVKILSLRDANLLLLSASVNLGWAIAIQ